jgi:hypothetical protein
MVIQIKSSDEFRRLFDALGDEIWAADFHNRLFVSLHEAIPKYQEEFNQSPTFWTFTFNGHRDAALVQLMRIYDSHRASLSLRNLLDTIQQNLSLFKKKPEEERLKSDIGLTNGNDPLVKKLLIWRHENYAHKGAQNVVNSYEISKDYPLSFDEIEQLIHRAYEILNRYQYLFDASIHSAIFPGLEDYTFVLEGIAGKLKQSDEERKVR